MLDKINLFDVQYLIRQMTKNFYFLVVFHNSVFTVRLHIPHSSHVHIGNM